MKADLQTQLNDNKRKVDFDTFDITVKELISMVDDSLIDIAPDYQRQFRWTEEGQSTFIESVFLGIPIPSLYTAANSDGTWELIDGVQRLSTLIHFMGSEEVRKKILSKPKLLSLSGLEKLTAFNGKTFEDLPSAIQRQFSLKPLKVTTISDKSNLDVRFDLFERLNTGGVKLEPQEIRSCIFRGEFNEMLKELAQNENFRRVVRVPDMAEKNGTREELVLRFFAFLNRYRKFEHSVVGFLNDYMKNVREGKEKFNYLRNQSLFNVVFEELSSALPNGITRGRNTTPVNLYEAVTVGAALAYLENGRIITKGVEEWIKSKELKDLTTGATNSRLRVEKRIEYCRDKFMGI
jgi:hypothetical protein